LGLTVCRSSSNMDPVPVGMSEHVHKKAVGSSRIVVESEFFLCCFTCSQM